MNSRLKLLVRRNKFLRQLIFFLLVGGVGFILDGGILTLMTEIGHIDPYASRAVSFPIAVSATWYLNRKWTFRVDSSIKKTTEYTRYFIVQVIGALLNLGIYALLIKFVPLFALHSIIPFAIGAFVAMVFNFLGAYYFVFRSTTSKNP
jgi:putative flippase GtrA